MSCQTLLKKPRHLTALDLIKPKTHNANETGGMDDKPHPETIGTVGDNLKQTHVNSDKHTVAASTDKETGAVSNPPKDDTHLEDDDLEADAEPVKDAIRVDAEHDDADQVDAEQVDATPVLPSSESSASLSSENSEGYSSLISDSPTETYSKQPYVPVDEELVFAVGEEQVDTVQVDTKPVDKVQVYAVPVPPSSESSLTSMTSKVSSSSLISDCSTGSVCGNDLRKRKRDIVILNAEADDGEACLYKTHLESPAINIPDITVDVLNLIGAGQSEFNGLSDITDLYNFVLVLVTENCIKCKKTIFHNEMVMTDILRNNCGCDCAVVPVWTKDSRKFTEKVPMELVTIKGLRYHNFESEILGGYYVDAVRKLVNNGRKNN